MVKTEEKRIFLFLILILLLVVYSILCNKYKKDNKKTKSENFVQNDMPMIQVTQNKNCILNFLFLKSKFMPITNQTYDFLYKNLNVDLDYIPKVGNDFIILTETNFSQQQLNKLSQILFNSSLNRYSKYTSLTKLKTNDGKYLLLAIYYPKDQIDMQVSKLPSKVDPNEFTEISIFMNQAFAKETKNFCSIAVRRIFEPAP